ncbi:hypothetical protein G6F56_006158 [Rhizopus delemar]|nr:hypothetical protein G6F56_006158 [Rhizopus delemar]
MSQTHGDSIPSLQLNHVHSKSLESIPQIELADLPIDVIRQIFGQEKDADISDLAITVEKLQVPSSNEQAINVEVYRPKSAAPEAILPVLLYLPGGGWCLPRQGLHPFFVSKLAIEINCTVIFVNYLLSPEVKFPYALEECFTVLNWLLDTNNAKSLSIDPSRLALSGDSAGGNISAALTILAKQRGLGHAIKRQVLIYPSVDIARDNRESYKEIGPKGYFPSPKIVRKFWGDYTRSTDDDESPLACPLRATIDELRGLPSALIVTSNADVLRDEGEEYARKLLLADVPVSAFRTLHTLHGFVSVPSMLCEETLNVIDAAAGFIRRAFAN